MASTEKCACTSLGRSFLVKGVFRKENGLLPFGGGGGKEGPEVMAVDAGFGNYPQMCPGSAGADKGPRLILSQVSARFLAELEQS